MNAETNCLTTDHVDSKSLTCVIKVNEDELIEMENNYR